MRWIMMTGGATLLLYGVFVLLTQLANRSVTRELGDLPQGERAQKVMLLTLPSGRTIPVNYLREAEVVYAGSDGRWWRELQRDGAPVVLEIRGEALGGHARAHPGCVRAAATDRSLVATRLAERRARRDPTRRELPAAHVPI